MLLARFYSTSQKPYFYPSVSSFSRPCEWTQSAFHLSLCTVLTTEGTFYLFLHFYFCVCVWISCGWVDAAFYRDNVFFFFTCVHLTTLIDKDNVELSLLSKETTGLHDVKISLGPPTFPSLDCKSDGKSKRWPLHHCSFLFKMGSLRKHDGNAKKTRRFKMTSQSLKLLLD